MHPNTPPPLPRPVQPTKSRHHNLLIGLPLVPALGFVLIVVLRIFGLLRPFSVPTGAMTPAVSAGDHVIMEGVSYLSRAPRRGEIVAFKTDDIESLQPGIIYLKRIAGEPGDHVRLEEGKLFVNDSPVALSNVVGEITYLPPAAGAQFAPQTNMTVSKACYYVLGDNSTNSADSRSWGTVPRANIIGRIALCYWPPKRVGAVK